MGETGTIYGPHFVDAAFVIGEVEELAGARYVYPVFVFIKF
jgi:hypothetical protein